MWNNSRMTAPVPENEEQRLEWLRQCEILDTLPEEVFDEAVQLAATLCRVPTAVINFVDQDRQWTKAAVGQDKKEEHRHVSFCAHTIVERDLLEVPDACVDTRFSDNPWVTGEPFIRFYAGAPLVTSEGYGIGSLCVVDHIPRRLSGEQAAVLRLLARQLVGRVELIRHIALQKELIASREHLLRDLLAEVTEGHLRLCLSPAALPLMLSPFAGSVRLSKTEGIRTLRQETARACEAAGMTDARSQDFQTAVGEAAMNAVVHSGSGMGSVFLDTGGTVQVRIEDHGPGIPLSDLPKATLKRGYSTAGTMGHGFKMVLMTADRVFLLTGSTGTTVMLEQDRTAPLAEW